jgi:AraC family transcriptional regulator
MSPRSVPYLGRLLVERAGGGLRTSLGAYPAVRQPLHVHARPAFSVLVAGQGVDRSRTQAYDQPPLTAVFHPTTAAHANDVGPRGALGLTLEMEPAWLEAQGLDERTLGGYQVVRPSLRSQLACLSLVGTILRHGPWAAADLETQALEFLDLLTGAQVRRETDPAPGWLARGEEFLRAHFRAPVRLSAAAREAGVHPVHFARVFRRRYGCSVSAYVRALRLADAAGRIVGASESLAAVACRTGFADQPHLTRCFARLAGCGPGALRRLARDFLPRHPGRRGAETGTR